MVAERTRLAGLKKLPAVTRDEVEISLQANLELPRDLAAALDNGATGIGLLRTEFLFMNRDDIPGEDEQYETLRGLVAGLGERPITVRTLDLGGDKLAQSLGAAMGSGVNPALGLRAIRLSMKYQPLLENQLAAILRAGAGGAVRILLPMISCVGEMRQVRAACRATVGVVGNSDHQNITIGKAGRKRHLGVRPQTRGKAMNPVDHPHGGGEGGGSLGNHPQTPWGVPTIGYRTRKKGKHSDRYIVRGRRRGKKGGR